MITRYTLGRSINSLQDVQEELQRVAEQMAGMVRFRGQFTSANESKMTPPPEAGDCWAVLDLAAGTVRMVVQADVGRVRTRYSWPVDVQKA